MFLLWGKYAHQKGAVVDRSRHHVLTASHPSPYSANGFFGCAISRGERAARGPRPEPVDWRL